MTCDHNTNVQELTPERLDLVAGGASIQEMMQNPRLVCDLLSNLSALRNQHDVCAQHAGISDLPAGDSEPPAPAMRKGRRALRHRPLLQLPAQVRFRCDSMTEILREPG
jgi:hypothetical protein